MASGEIALPMRDVARNVTVKIALVGVTGFKIRLAIALWLFRLGGLVSGLNVVVEHEKT